MGVMAKTVQIKEKKSYSFFSVDTHRLGGFQNICSRLHAVDDLKCWVSS